MIKAIACIQIITSFTQHKRQEKRKNSKKKINKKKGQFNVYLQQAIFDVKL